MIDVCTRVCIMRWSFLPFWDVFSSLNFSMLFVFRSTPSSPVWLFSFFLHIGCRAMHLEGTLICSHLYKSPFQVSPHSHVQELTIFCVYMGSAFAKLNFECLSKSTPHLDGWAGWVGLWTRAECHLWSCQQMVNTGTRLPRRVAQLSAEFSKWVHGSRNDVRSQCSKFPSNGGS